MFKRKCVNCKYCKPIMFWDIKVNNYRSHYACTITEDMQPVDIDQEHFCDLYTEDQ